MSDFKIGLQLYTLRRQFVQDGMIDTLAKLNKLGIHYVEWSLDNLTDKQFDDLLFGCDRFDIQIPSVRFDMDLINSDEEGNFDEEDIKQQIEQAKALGAKYLWNLTIPRYAFGSKEGFERCAKTYAKLSDLTYRYGIKTYHHTHHFEFEKFDGKYGLDILLDACDKEKFGIEMDTFYMHKGGQYIFEWFERLNGQMDLMHIKDWLIWSREGELIDDTDFEGSVEFGEVGEGNLPMKRIIDAASKSGCKYFFIEQDETQRRDVYDAIDYSMNNVRKMGYAGNFI